MLESGDAEKVAMWYVLDEAPEPLQAHLEWFVPKKTVEATLSIFLCAWKREREQGWRGLPWVAVLLLAVIPCDLDSATEVKPVNALV